MFRFAASRIAMAIPTLLIVAVSVFVLIRMIPGDPAQLLLGDLATPASLAELRARLGLDRSVPAQFGIWFGHVLQGDLGTSINSGQDVLSLVTERFLISGRIVLVAVALAAMVAVPAGMIAAWKQNRAPDLLLVGAATLLVSIPTFWLGLLLLLLFGLKLGWLPVVGYRCSRCSCTRSACSCAWRAPARSKCCGWTTSRTRGPRACRSARC